MLTIDRVKNYLSTNSLALSNPQYAHDFFNTLNNLHWSALIQMEEEQLPVLFGQYVEDRRTAESGKVSDKKAEYWDYVYSQIDGTDQELREYLYSQQKPIRHADEMQGE